MRGLFCQNCSERLELFTTGPGNRAVFLMDIPFLGRIPIAPRLEECDDAGESFLEKYPDSEAVIGYNLIAQKIITGNQTAEILKTI
jgi:hypothetical protein